MRATAAMKWINKYRQLTPGNKPPTPEVRAALQQAENAMRAVRVTLHPTSLQFSFTIPKEITQTLMLQVKKRKN